jgi:hypothetical protein
MALTALKWWCSAEMLMLTSLANASMDRARSKLFFNHPTALAMRWLWLPTQAI